jgi:hypothetical protein
MLAKVVFEFAEVGGEAHHRNIGVNGVFDAEVDGEAPR